MRLQVGGLEVPLEQAEGAIHEYTRPRGSNEDPTAYPYYDALTTADDNVLVDGDFLAAVLLNALRGKPIRVFRYLKDHEARLREALGNIDRELSLVDATSEEVSLIGPLYSILDEEAESARHVKGSTISKVFHRKRPAFIPLYDRHIRWCYVMSEGAPIKDRPDQSWADFMIGLAAAIKKDLAHSASDWDALCDSAPGGSRISPLRALDIVAWKIGGSAMQEAESKE